MGIPMAAGRSFGPEDTATAPKVGIINQALARKRFPNVNPIGKRFKADDEKSEWIQIVGICKDTHYAEFAGRASSAVLYALSCSKPRLAG